MRGRPILRGAAIAMAITGVIDPSWRSGRYAPAPVELAVAPAAADDLAAASKALRRRLEATLGEAVSFDSPAEPVARVLVAGVSLPRGMRHDVPTSTVMPRTRPPADVRIIAARNPPAVPPGWTTTVSATIEAEGLAGAVTRIVLEQQGAEIASVEHTWSRSLERVDVSIPYAPPIDGLSRVTLRAIPHEREARAADNAVDLRARTRSRRLKVLSHEPRASWAAAFVRRALEENHAFEASAHVQVSRGLNVIAGGAPATLTPEAIAPFEVILTGAPEELRPEDVRALRDFAERRGGTVVLLPDRRPSGEYLTLMPPLRFEETLVDKPIDLSGGGRVWLRATELSLPRGDLRAAEALVSATVEGVAHPAVISWRLGAGRVVLSGALDAWRFRADVDQDFARFWTTRIAEAALTAPPPLSVSVTPSFAAPGEPLTIMARLRRTEMDESAGRTHTPAMSARLLSKDGAAAPLRLWPTAERGAFEAVLQAPRPGDYTVEAASGSLVAEDVLTVAADLKRVTPTDAALDDEARLIATATGGVVVSVDAVTVLEDHLRSLARGRREVRLYPARSPWFAAAFVALLCLEWTLRRRRGLA
jgi:hypothetical protein